MSRTWKDRPLRIQLHENMKKGLIDHDHREIPPREITSYGADRKLSVTFYKWAQKEIAEHKATLDAMGDNVVYEIVEHAGTYNWDSRDFYSRPVYSEKTVEFVVKKK